MGKRTVRRTHAASGLVVAGDPDAETAAARKGAL
jgi:hypothetical protein